MGVEMTRRGVLGSAIGAAVVGAMGRVGIGAEAATEVAATRDAEGGRVGVHVPNGRVLEWKMVGGVKVFHLVAEEVEHEFAPGLRAKVWGYNGGVHGPVIEAVEGDRVRFFVTNKLLEATTVHWHGVVVPSGMDGVGGLSQAAIGPGETFVYEFELKQHGTFMYHAHHDEMTQMGMGLTGMFVIHPKGGEAQVDRDYVLLLHEWRIDPGTQRPNPLEMTDFNVLTMNGKCFPGTEPLVAQVGERVRIRLGNLGAMSHHPLHIHGLEFEVVEMDGGAVPATARVRQTSVLVPVGTTRVLEVVADNAGDWAFHCHMSHHVMNQMGHNFPNMIGMASEGMMDPLDEKIRRLVPGYMTMATQGTAGMGEMGMTGPENSIPMSGGKGKHGYITMGGMFTVVKVREKVEGYGDPGWYENPAGTEARKATAEELRANGIEAAT